MNNHVCWKEENTISVTSRDAASLTDAVFQAVHHPLPITKRRIESRKDGEKISELDLAEFIKSKLRPDGYLLVPIVGSSGTGKSHLVRWLQVNTSDTEGWECRYLPKNDTGLKRTIETIIRDSDNPKLIDIKETLANSASSDEREEIVSQRLLDELAILISDFENLPISKAVSSDPKVSQLRNRLIEELPDLFHDPVAREAMTRNGAVIPRLVKLAISGRSADDGLDDDASVFSEIDLPLSSPEIANATKKVNKLLARFKVHPDSLKGAVDLINLVLPEACKRISITNKVDLVEIFRIVRREIANSNKELVLFIEDLTVLHGVEQEFLDAIIEPVNHPDGKLCNLRVVFAITEGHFDNLDTVRTRCEDAFWLDVRYGEQGVGTSDIINFVGRYLNLTRINPSDIESEWINKRHSDWLPNACAKCSYMDECHETFGKSDQSFGIYPFTSTAIHKFVEALSEARFDPRNIVRQLIFNFLNQSKVEIETDQFPSENLLRPFNSIERLDPLEETEIRNQVSTNEIGDRVVGIARYWIAESSPDDIYHAFNLPIIAIDRKARASSFPSVAMNTQLHASSVVKPLAKKRDSSPLFNAIQNWSTRDKPLSMGEVDQLRRKISKLVVTNLRHSTHPYSDSHSIGISYVEDRIRFFETASKGSKKNSLIEIEKSPESALVLQAIVIGDEDLYEDFDEGELESYHLSLSRAIKKWIDSLARHMADERSSLLNDDLIRLLEMQSALGVIRPIDSASHILSKLFLSGEQNEDAPRPESGTSISKWTDYVNQANYKIRGVHSKIRTEFGEGRAGPRILDAGYLYPIIDTFHQEARPNAHMATNPLAISKEILIAIEKTWSQVPKLFDLIESEIDLEEEWPLQTSKVIETTKLALAMSTLKSYDFERVKQLENLANSTQQFYMQRYSQIDEKIKSNEVNWFHKATFLSSINLIEIQDVAEFIKIGNELIQNIEANIKVLGSSKSGTEINRNSLETLLNDLSNLRTAIGEY